MLTRLRIKNFKLFEEVDIDLGQSVVFIGPNNSGKTSALQALTLWFDGLKQWNNAISITPRRTTGTAINRILILNIPVSNTNLLFRNRKTRDHQGNKHSNTLIKIAVSGFSNNDNWEIEFEYYYSNSEILYCKPSYNIEYPKASAIPRIAFLPPMSGLISEEPLIQSGRINVLIGEGQTAQVLRNICYNVYENKDGKDWEKIVKHIEVLFGETLLRPQYLPDRGAIALNIKNRDNVILDISSTGRGLQQTLLLLAFLYSNPRSVILLDEPDAHLEILRQRQVYDLIKKVAETLGSQIIAASHSEVVLNEAVESDKVIAFLGKRPHTINDKGTQLLKSLRDFGFEQYYQAELKGWILYLEGSSDLTILREFARILQHKAFDILKMPFVQYIQQASKAREHFFGIKEGKDDLTGILIMDKNAILQSHPDFNEIKWRKNEIENYICIRSVFLDFALKGDYLEFKGSADYVEMMEQSLTEISKSYLDIEKVSPWSPDTNASKFMQALFDNFFNRIGQRNILNKSNYHILLEYLPVDNIDPEIIEKLDAIVETAMKAKTWE